MASVKSRKNKDGSTSYLLRAYIEEGANGKQITKSTTWRPPVGMRPSAADKQAEKEAILFEERVRNGIISLDGKTKFEEYASRWMEAAELAPKTREQYDYLLVRINKEIGHIPLEKLRADHLQDFLQTLKKAGAKQSEFAESITLDEKRKELKLTYTKLAEISGLSRETVTFACKGKRIAVESAKKISAGIKCDIKKLFKVSKSTEKLSARTVWHYHKLIRAILASAKQSRIVQFNVAAEHMDAPKLPRDEANFLNDVEAKKFVDALLNEPDIRIKAAFALALFTGERRGELCGLSWSDIDFENNTVYVRKASQYITGQGVTEVQTKTKSSKRAITVPKIIMSILSEYHSWWIDYSLALGDAWRGEESRLFIKADGTPIFPATINHWLRKFIMKNNLPYATPQTLRHTFASLQLAEGVDLRTLQARTGHAQASTLLNVYTHAIQSAQERAAQVMSDLLLSTSDDVQS